jgi:hypothetical protein
MANAGANQEQPQPQEPPQAPKQPPHEETGQKPLKLKLGPLEIEGPLSIVSGLIGGLILGGVVIFYLAIFQGQPAFIVDPILKEKYSAFLAAQPTLTPQPPKTVEVIKTVPVEVVRTVEVLKTVEVVQTVPVVETVEVERTVEVPVTVTVIVTPTPLSPPEVLKSRLETAFQDAQKSLVSKQPISLSAIWLGKVAITEEIQSLRDTFSYIDPDPVNTHWTVGDVSVLKKEEGVEVYTLEASTVLTITGTYPCNGQDINDTLELTYPSLIRAEIQDPDTNVVRVRIYSWTKNADPVASICPSNPN